MMKMKMRSVAAVLVFVWTLGGTGIARADDPLAKFSRGVCNILTCYAEVQNQAKKVKDEQGSFAGMTYGLVKGLVMTGMRALVGIFEVATCPFPWPPEYKPILTDPVNFLETEKIAEEARRKKEEREKKEAEAAQEKQTVEEQIKTSEKQTAAPAP